MTRINAGSYGGSTGHIVPPSQKGYGCFLGFAMAFSLMGRGGAATFVGADIADRDRGRGRVQWKSGLNKLKYHGLTQPNGGGPTPFWSQAHIWRIHPSLLTSTPHTRFIALARILPPKSPTFSPFRIHTACHFVWTRHQVSVNIVHASISESMPLRKKLSQQQN